MRSVFLKQKGSEFSPPLLSFVPQILNQYPAADMPAHMTMPIKIPKKTPRQISTIAPQFWHVILLSCRLPAIWQTKTGTP